MTENEIKAEARKLGKSLKAATSCRDFDLDPVTREFLHQVFMQLDLEGEKFAAKINLDPKAEIQYHKHVHFWNWGLAIGCFLSELGRFKVILNGEKAGETTMSGENTGET